VTTPALLADLRRDEGLRLAAYRDGGGVWTIGYGHTGAEVVEGLEWTPQAAEQALAADVASAQAGLDAALPWWRSLSPARQDAICEMAFNLGVAGLLGFRRTLGRARAGRYAAAGRAMLASRWARQVGARAQRLAQLMQTGERP
jgi:lysozyme